jgi:xanthine dehydrogenase YagS FAD-binding subunit
MKDLVVLQPTSVQEATRLAERWGRTTSYYAGGQDLLYRLKRRLTNNPRYLIDLKGIPELANIRLEDGTLRVGPLVRLSELAESNVVRRLFPALAAAADSIASPQIRNAGTVAGNLCQDVWCWYLLEDFACNLNGGKYCPAAAGENSSYHSAVAQKRCVAVHPSDLAPALLALDARVTVCGPGGDRALGIDELLPGLCRAAGTYRVNALRDGELVTEIVVPPAPSGARQAFAKDRFRQSWDFAIVSAAVRVVLDGGVCREARIGLGGVAIHPWRATEAERHLVGRPFDRAACAAASQAVLSGVRLLQGGRYKQALARELTRTTLESMLDG